jgi:hypothetical protein
MPGAPSCGSVAPWAHAERCLVRAHAWCSRQEGYCAAPVGVIARHQQHPGDTHTGGYPVHAATRTQHSPAPLDSSSKQQQPQTTAADTRSCKAGHTAQRSPSCCFHVCCHCRPSSVVCRLLLMHPGRLRDSAAHEGRRCVLSLCVPLAAAAAWRGVPVRRFCFGPTALLRSRARSPCAVRQTQGSGVCGSGASASWFPSGTAPSPAAPQQGGAVVQRGARGPQVCVVCVCACVCVCVPLAVLLLLQQQQQHGMVCLRAAAALAQPRCCCCCCCAHVHAAPAPFAVWQTQGSGVCGTGALASWFLSGTAPSPAAPQQGDGGSAQLRCNRRCGREKRTWMRPIAQSSLRRTALLLQGPRMTWWCAPPLGCHAHTLHMRHTRLLLPKAAHARQRGPATRHHLAQMSLGSAAPRHPRCTQHMLSAHTTAAHASATRRSARTHTLPANALILLLPS